MTSRRGGRDRARETFFDELIEDLRHLLDREEGGGALMYAETERIVAQYAYGPKKTELPPPGSDDPRHRTRIPVGSDADSSQPAAAWQLLDDFWHEYLFNLSDAQAFRLITPDVLDEGLTKFDRALFMLLRNYVWGRMHDAAVVGLRDRLCKGLGERFVKDHGLVFVKLHHGAKSGYWSQQTRSVDELLAIQNALDEPRGFDDARDDILQRIEPIMVVKRTCAGEGKEEKDSSNPKGFEAQRLLREQRLARRHKSGYGDKARAAMAAAFCAALSTFMPDLGKVTLIVKEDLLDALTTLIVREFPELVHISSDETPQQYGDVDDSDNRSLWDTARFGRDMSPESCIAAALAALGVMEELTFAMPAKEANQEAVSGAKLKRVLRLQLSLASALSGTVPLQAIKDAWTANPQEPHGTRSVSMPELLSNFPTPDESPSPPSPDLLARCQRLLDAFRAPLPAVEVAALEVPPSSMSIRKWRPKVLGMLSEAAEPDDSAASPTADTAAWGLTLRWFVDMLFLEVGMAPPLDEDHQVRRHADAMLVGRAVDTIVGCLSGPQEKKVARRRAALALRWALRGALGRTYARAARVDDDAAAAICSAPPEEALPALEDLGIGESAVSAGAMILLAATSQALAGGGATFVAGRFGITRSQAESLTSIGLTVVSDTLDDLGVPDHLRDQAQMQLADELEARVRASYPGMM